MILWTSVVPATASVLPTNSRKVLRAQRRKYQMDVWRKAHLFHYLLSSFVDELWAVLEGLPFLWTVWFCIPVQTADPQEYTLLKATSAQLLKESTKVNLDAIRLMRVRTKTMCRAEFKRARRIVSRLTKTSDLHAYVDALKSLALGADNVREGLIRELHSVMDRSSELCGRMDKLLDALVTFKDSELLYDFQSHFCVSRKRLVVVYRSTMHQVNGIIVRYREKTQGLIFIIQHDADSHVVRTWAVAGHQSGWKSPPVRSTWCACFVSVAYTHWIKSVNPLWLFTSICDNMKQIAVKFISATLSLLSRLVPGTDSVLSWFSQN